MLAKKLKRTVSLLLLIVLIFNFSSMALAADEAETGSGSIPVDYVKAAYTSEKMYYCGELYLFTDNMMKINYEMAAIAANLKEYINGSLLTSDKTTLNNLIKQYNIVCKTYNSWVDVKPSLEKYIEVIDDNLIYTNEQLQSAFTDTLATINATKPLLESARIYAENTTTNAKIRLNNSINSTIRKGANASKAIEPYLARSMRGYRSFFDEFSELAGIKIAVDDQ